MTKLGERLDCLYRKIGERGVIFALFVMFFFTHLFFNLGMKAPSVNPEELGTAAWSAFFSGFDWSGASETVTAFYGYVSGLIYVPFTVLIKDPFVLYRCMLIVNGLFASFIPVLIYKLCSSFGLKKAWQRILCALTGGLCVSAFTYTKFIWNETPCALFPWLLLYVLIRAFETKNSALKQLLSVLAALLCAVSSAANPRLWVLVVAIVFTVIFARVYLKTKIVFLSGFLPALAVFCTLQIYASFMLSRAVFGETISPFDNLLNILTGVFTAEGAVRFLQTLSGQLYYFAVSSWGLGVLAVCLVFSVLFSVNEKKKSDARQKKLSRMALRKLPEPAKPEFNKVFIILCFYALTANVLTLIASAASLAAEPLTSQDLIFFGRYIDAVLPLMLVLTLCYVFNNGLGFRKLLISIIGLGAIFLLFFLFAAPAIADLSELSVNSVVGLSPVRIGEAIDAPITNDGMFLTVSAVFCFSALLIVLVSCADRFSTHIISSFVVLTVIYTFSYSAAVYLPYAARLTETQNMEAYQLSDYIFNSSDAPKTYIVNPTDELPLMLQYLSNEAKILTVKYYSDLPADCIVIVPKGGLDIIDYEKILLGETKSYSAAAYGERAIAFVHSQVKD